MDDLAVQIEEFIVLIPNTTLRNKIAGSVFVQYTNFAALKQRMELANKFACRLVLDDALCLLRCQLIQQIPEPLFHFVAQFLFQFTL